VGRYPVKLDALLSGDHLTQGICLEKREVWMKGAA